MNVCPPENMLGVVAVTAPQNAFTMPRLEEVAATWNGIYKNEGYVWGRGPYFDPGTDFEADKILSKTIIDDLHIGRRKFEIVDVGGGYGQRLMRYAQMGSNVTIIDIAPESLKLGWKLYSNVFIPGSSRFLLGSMQEALRTEPYKEFDVITTFRAVHLMGDRQAGNFFTTAAERSKPDALFFGVARSPADFKPSENEWLVEGKIAKMKDPTRKGQILSFWDAERWESKLKDNFRIVSHFTCQEPNTAKQPEVMTQLSGVIAIRTDQPPVPVNGNGYHKKNGNGGNGQHIVQNGTLSAGPGC